MKWYVLVIFLVTALSIAGLLVVSLNLDPYKTGTLIKFLFFISLFMAFWGFSTSVLNKFKFKPDWPDFYKSFTMGLIISLVVCLSIFLIRYVRY